MPDSILLSAIDDSSRARDRKKYGNLTGIKESIQRIGLIQPIVLSLVNDKPILVVGGRRFAAMKELGIKELFHGSTLNPTRLGYVLENEVPHHTRLEAELDENLYRLEMDWIDSILLITDIHEKKKAVEHGWGMRQTAELLGAGYGLAKISNAVAIAKELRKGNKELAECPNLSAAVATLIKQNEDIALARMQEFAATKLPKVSTPLLVVRPIGDDTGGLNSFLDSLGSGPKYTAKPVPGVGLQQRPVETVKQVEVPLSQMFFCADSVRPFTKPNDAGVTYLPFLSTLPDASFDHIVTDIPYGIDMSNLDADLVTDVAAEHDVDSNISLMLPFLTQAYHLVRPGGFCVFFYDLAHHEKLQAWAEQVGWKTQRWPFIACKISSCKNNAPQYNTSKNYEVAMFLRRDEHTVLRKPVPTSWKTYDFAAERKLYNNPFAKPFALWKDIFDAIAFTGQSILDPFAGEMSSCRAAANCGLVPYGVEIKVQHFNRGLEHMKAVYALIHKSNVLFT